jgi:hypothetical protein
MYSFSEPRPMASVAFESDTWVHVPFGPDAILAFSGHLEAWQEQLIEKVAALGALPENWNSYRSRPIDIDTAGFAVCTLLNNLQHDDPMPSIVPTSNGGIMVEWHVAGVDLEIDFRSPTWVQLSFEKDGTESEVDDASMTQLSECIAQLRDAR